MEMSIPKTLQYLITRSRLLFSLIPPVLTNIMLYVTSILKGQMGKSGIPPMGIKLKPENPELRV